MSNILQSDIWARFQESNGHTVIRKSGNGWSYLATVEGGATGRYLYSPYGPVASSAVAFDEALASLKEEAAKLRCLFVRIEPTESAIWGDQDAAAFLARRGAVLAPRQVQPSHTQIIDLSGTEDEILKGMSSSYRNRHRNLHKKGVTVEVSTNPSDMTILFGFLEETADRNGFNRQQDEYLMQVARVLMPAGVPVATVSINGARNAGLLALRILGSGTDAFAQQVHADLRQFSQNLRQTAMDKGAALRTRVAEAKAKAAAEREAEESSSAPRPIPAPEASSEPQAYVP